jgi:hypothetical protein
MVKVGRLAGYKSFREARNLASRKKLPSARTKIKNSLNAIGLSYERAVAEKKKPGISKERKELPDHKIEKLRELQNYNLALAKEKGIKL